MNFGMAALIPGLVALVVGMVPRGVAAEKASAPAWPTMTTASLPLRTAFRRGENLRFKAKKGKVRSKIFAKEALGGESTPDGRWVFVANGGPGGRLFKAEGGKARKVRTDLVISSQMSPDGSVIAVLSEKGDLTIHEIPSGAEIARQKGAQSPLRFESANTLLFRKGCQLFRWRFGGALTAVGPEACGEARAGPRGRTWLIGTPGGYRAGTGSTFKELRILDVASESIKTLVEGTDNDPILAPQVVTPTRVCFVRRTEQKFFPLYCVSPGDTMAALVLHGDVEHPGWCDPSGRFMVFANGQRGQSRAIWLVDFESSILHLLDRNDALYWRFIADGKRIVMWGGDSHTAVLYDLSGNWQISLYPKKVQPGGLIPIPGDARRLILGKERGGSRDLWLLTLPAK